MNKPHPSERLVRSTAFSLTLLLYTVGGAVCYILFFISPEEKAQSVSIPAVNLRFAQMELVAIEETPPPKKPEPPPPEEVDVVLEEIVEEPEPDPEPVEADAQISQEASADETEVDTDALSKWVLEQIQKEKYYPPSAQRAGHEGAFDLLVVIDPDGTITEASISYGKGHPLLRRSLEKMLGKLIGRSFGKPIVETVEMEVEFEFDLN